MTDLEPSSDWRTWSITVPSPASEQSVTSSPLQTSATLYSIFRIIATPFLKFFSIFLSFFFFVRFLPASRFFQSTLAFFSFHPFPRFAFPISTLPCVSFKRFISTPPSVSYCLYANHSQTFSSTPRLILYILHIHSFIFSSNPSDFLLFRFLLSRFSTIQCLMSDVRCFARFLFCSPCSSVRSVYDRLYVLPSSAPPRFAKHGRLAMRAVSRSFCTSKKMPSPHREEHLP